jgi:glycosyltransferase involved in cell wall biosynthesis
LPAYRHARCSAYVSISDADRSPELDYVATVHHGIDLVALPLSAAGGEGLVAFGRIHPDKGTAAAIDIARRAGRRLTICGIVQDAAYFREQVEPHIDGDRVTYLGSVGPERRAEVLGAAAALLHPISFNEPFGLSVVEAMACGTPVIAYPRGSMPEIIDVGLTGFLVDDAQAAAAAVAAAVGLDRVAIRRVAERRFGAARMVDAYLSVYQNVLANPTPAASPR